MFTSLFQVGIWWQKFSAFFWTPSFWLYPGLDWKDVEKPELNSPSFYDIWVYPLLFSLIFLVFIFFVLEPYVLDPLARLGNIPNKQRRPPQPSKILEKLYLTSGRKPSKDKLKKAANLTDMSVRQVERWLRHRHATTVSTKYEKFMDCGFNFLMHTFVAIFGSSVMYSKPWLWDITLCWKDYPYHGISDDVWWYYVLSLTYFWAATFRQVLIPGRSAFDRTHFLVHHVLTILLMVFSWASNFVRVGTLVLLVHEVSDIPLTLAKMLLYCGYKGVTDVLFGVFVLSWVYTRCYLYIAWIMHSVFTHPSDMLYLIPAGYLFKVLLCGLLLVNSVWTALIFTIVFKKLSGGPLQDVRSDTEDFSDEGDNEVTEGEKKDN